MYTQHDQTGARNPYNKVRFIDVYGPLAKFGGLIYIGTLSQIHRPYVFEYALNDHAMVSKTLSGLDAVRNETMNLMDWGFFRKRMPNPDSPTVLKYIEDTQLDGGRPMSILAVFGVTASKDNRILVSRL